MLELKQPSKLILTGLSIGIIANILFFNQSIGISVLLFVVVILSALRTTLIRSKLELKKGAIAISIAILFFAFMAMIRATPLLVGINLLMICFLLLMLGLYAANDGFVESGILGHIFRPIRAMFVISIKPAPLLYRSVDLKSMSGGTPLLMPIARGAVLGAPILIVFTFLLASADVLFAQTLINLLTLNPNFGITTLLVRVIFMTTFSWIGLGWLQFAIRDQVPAVRTTIPEQILMVVSKQKPLGLIETITVLLMITALFGFFVFIQFAYLFGGTAFLELGEISHAQYARRGFFELLTVAILTLLTLQMFNHLYNRDNPRATIRFNLFASAIIGFVLVMLTSAYNRLALYEWTFGFTELRLYTHVFMIWMGLTLVWYLFTLWRNPTRFAIGALVAMIGFVGTLNIINPERIIVNQNLKRFELMGHLDLNYLTTLSSDAVPQLIVLNEEIKGSDAIKSETACQTLRYLEENSSRLSEITIESDSSLRSSSPSTSTDCIETNSPDLLQDNLDQRLEALSSNPRRWPEFHLSHWRAKRLLSKAQS